MAVAQVARVMGLSVSTIYEAVRRGEIAAIHFGRRVLVPRSEVDRLLGRTPGPGNAGANPNAASQKDGGARRP